jgi:ubiquinone biosynthesis accessory factor UbiK
MIDDNLIRSLGDQLGRFIGDSAAREDMQKSLNTIVQNVFARLDLVTREQFDAQLETLERTRAQLERLEAELARLQGQLVDQEQSHPS